VADAAQRAGVLTGVGVGPGDPELLTLKGLAVLREADLVVVPVRDDREETGHAERVVRAHLPGAALLRAPFALNDRGGLSGRRTRAWDAAAQLVARGFADGARHVAFATIGDPNVYSTFAYLAATVRELRPGTEVRTVPGITAMQALASSSGTVLCEGREPLLLLPALSGPEELDAALAQGPAAGASVVAYKGGRQWPALRRVLERHGRLPGAVVGSRLGLAAERIAPARELNGELPYLTTVIAPAARGGRGSKL
jgi:precorrin-2/cobalt-factor-2 C20-methyltransferase